MNNKIPKKYHPQGFEILYEDRDIIVGIKAAGFLTVRALWNKDTTIHAGLNTYLRKGQSKSHKRAFVVHRLDQDTSGVLIFAKSEEAQMFLKDHWPMTTKIYDVIIHGRMKNKSGLITSYLEEDEDYVVHTVAHGLHGKLAQTQYKVIRETTKFSWLEINLLTGRKNQIRVHFAEAGHPVVGDAKYGRSDTKHRRLALHARSIYFTHPFTKKRLTFIAPTPEYFGTIMGVTPKF